MVLLILAAVSGTGKSTIGRELLKRNARLKLSVSHTTRDARSGEVDGRHYHFVSRAEFDDMVGADGFAEWAEYVGNCYGTAKSTIESAGRAGHDLLFDIEIQGAAQLKAQYPDAVTVFLLPPSWDEVSRRLTLRGTDDAETISQRLERGRVEVEAARSFDYLVVNDDLDEAIEAVEDIYRAARNRASENLDKLDALV